VLILDYHMSRHKSCITVIVVDHDRLSLNSFIFFIYDQNDHGQNLIDRRCQLHSNPQLIPVFLLQDPTSASSQARPCSTTTPTTRWATASSYSTHQTRFGTGAAVVAAAASAAAVVNAETRTRARTSGSRVGPGASPSASTALRSATTPKCRS